MSTVTKPTPQTHTPIVYRKRADSVQRRHFTPRVSAGKYPAGHGVRLTLTTTSRQLVTKAKSRHPKNDPSSLTHLPQSEYPQAGEEGTKSPLHSQPNLKDTTTHPLTDKHQKHLNTTTYAYTSQTTTPEATYIDERRIPEGGRPTP